MTIPVVVSRIENRRGTQLQFNALYPTGYSGIGGFNNSTPAGPLITTTATGGTGTVATVSFAAATYLANAPIGSSVTVTGVTPLAYNGTYTVTASTATSVSFASTATGAQTIAGDIFAPFNNTNFPNVLLLGELALCTDTRNVFLGNINGEFIKISVLPANDTFLQPMVLTLPPQASFTIIPELTYSTTPFYDLLYDLTDSASSNWNIVGTNFSRNGKLEITAVDDFAPILNPPFPPITPVVLNDIGTENNLASPNSISFMAQYDITTNYIEILYKHDFSGSLTFSTNSIQWLPF